MNMPIKSAWLVTNYTCNNNCNFCYLRGIINTDSKLMPLDFAFEVINELVRIRAKRCIIIGGEPTLYPYLIELIEYGQSRGLSMNIVTNGRKLADKIFIGKLVDAGVSSISVSVEAFRKEDYTKTCGTDYFEETINGIKNCISFGVSVSSITTICDSNHFLIADIVQLIYSLGVRNIVLSFGIPSIDVSDGTIPLCSYSIKMRNEMIKANVIPSKTYCHLFPGSGIVFEPNGLVIPSSHPLKWCQAPSAPQKPPPTASPTSW